jgi:hypothetical protein
MRWEKSSWTKIELPPADRLRYALIVPRLLSPHPNRGAGSELRPDQGLALAVQVRLNNLREYTRELEDVPKISEMNASAVWGWRFVGAFSSRLLDDDPGPLAAVAGQAPDGPSRAAASVAAACALLDRGRVDDGLAFLEQALDGQTYSPVDLAWLEAQRARFDRQVGRLAEASAGAYRARAILEPVSGDPTADAIDAGAAALINSLAGFEKASFEAAMIAGDTVAVWWRAQELASANGRIAQRGFEKWARDRTVTVGGEDVAANRLLAAAIMSSHAVDQGGWAGRTAAIGRDQLLRLDRSADPEEAAAALDSLRKGGDDKSLRLAATHLLADGPAAAVATAARSVDLRHSTQTSVLADLVLLERGGDVLDRRSAERAADRLLEYIFDPSALTERTTPHFLLGVQLVETLTGVIQAAGPRGQRELTERISQLPAQKGELEAREWANLLWTIPAEAWSEGTARRAAVDAERHAQVLERALLGIAARYGGEGKARERLIAEALEGSLSALGQIGDVTELSSDVAGKLVGILAAAVRGRIEEATSGSISLGVPDPAEALGVLNLWHPEAASWEPLIELLGDDRVHPVYKRRALLVLAASADRIPASIRGPLRPLVSRLIEEGPVRHSPLEDEPDVRGPALDLGIAIGAIDEATASEIVLAWLAGDDGRRRWAAHAAYRLARCEDIGLLSALASDPDPSVRAAASAALTAMSPDAPMAEESIRRALRLAQVDPGVEVPRAMASALAGAGEGGEFADWIRRGLRQHISATVRSLASQQPDGDSADPSGPGPQVSPFDNPYRRTTLQQLRDY